MTDPTSPPAALGVALRDMADRLTALYGELEAALPAVAGLAGEGSSPRREEMAEEGSVHLALALGQVREGALRVDAVATLAHLAAAPWADYGPDAPGLSLTVVFPRQEPSGDGAPTSGSG